VGCWHGYLSAARCRLAYGPADGPLPFTVSCFSKIQIVLPFWYRLTWLVPEKGPLNGTVTDIHTLGCYTQHITSHTDTGAAATVYRIWPLLQCTESIIHTLHHQCSQCQTNLSSKPRTCITVLSTNPVHNVLLHLNYRFSYHTSRHTSFTILVLFRRRCDMLRISYKVK